ncbi:hypothetical protein Acr_11g0009330 [Actinidia rufa]|uniref:Uncharacterized protein n=1 Tax=Actinidia rufa TaxID=165716 RepID=A0A7J0FFF5_9ERIC|nr:hypothetical protein Acr_11g0009330 [Actinidia rufa]
MHLRNGLLPRQSTSNPLDNRARPMANISQAPNLENIHREMHGIAEQIKIMNEINARLVQHLATNNPPPPTAHVLEDVDRSRRSCRIGQLGDAGDHITEMNRAHSRHDKSTTQVPIEIKNEDFVKWSGKIKNNLL